MKIVILCGGQGTRIRDVSEILPKPMLPIGDRPILWHIMKRYAKYGCKDFVLCLGYKGWMIKEFFLNYHAMMSTVKLTIGAKGSVSYDDSRHDEADWNVTMVDTGEETLTAGRVWQASKYLDKNQPFGLTYGDGLADIDIDKLLKQHNNSGMIATMTGVHPSGRFGEIEIDGDRITEFNEKPNVNTGLINGGFMIFNYEALKKYFNPDENLSLEKDVLPRMVKDGKVGVYKHGGQWQCIDTQREYTMLNQLWNEHKGKVFWNK